jgi:exosortase family protein XrtM
LIRIGHAGILGRPAVARRRSFIKPRSNRTSPLLRFARPMSSAPAAVPHHRWILGLICFVAIYLVLYAGYMSVPDRWLIEQVYFHAIVAPGAAAIHALATGDPVQAIGNRLIHGGSVIEIVRGCDGAAMLFLLAAAIGTFAATRQASMRAAAWGLLGALAAVWVLYQARVVTLYFAVTRHPDWFVPLHAVVFPTLFVLCGLVYFSLWSAGAARRDAPQAA